MNVDRNAALLRHRFAEPGKICLGRVLEIDGNMDIGHAQAGDGAGFVRQRLFMAVQPKIDDVAHAEGLDGGQFRLGRLARGGDPVIQPEPVIDRVGIGHGCLSSSLERRSFTPVQCAR